MLIPHFGTAKFTENDYDDPINASDDNGDGWRVSDTEDLESVMAPKFARKIDCESFIRSLNKLNIDSIEQMENLPTEEYAEIISNSLFW